VSPDEARALLEAPSPVPLARRVLREVYHPAALVAAACAAAVVLLLAPPAWAWQLRLCLAGAAACAAAPGTRPWVVVLGFAPRLGRALADHADDPEAAAMAVAGLLVEYVEYCRTERAPAAAAGLLAAALIAILRVMGVMP